MPYLRDTSRWLWKPAKAWQFWRPQSGMVGGMIFSVILFITGWLIWFLVLS